MKKEIYLAGGCFWGLEKYMELIPGVLSTEVGYANGNTENPTYEEVCYEGTGHAETVKVIYDEGILSLEYLLELYYGSINPLTLNRQGNDYGEQYRTGIYFAEKEDEAIILESIRKLELRLNEKVEIEVKPLENYYKAEEYHQKYLDKNPHGYCHIGRDKFENAKNAKDPKKRGNLENSKDMGTLFQKKSKEALADTLSPMEFNVTQHNGTEPPFTNVYFNHFEEGIYTDVTTGEPLFSSKNKFKCECGWPSFSKPIKKELLVEIADKSHGMIRTEVRSTLGDAHLGHVFSDGPKELGGLRYCINSASLKFIPKNEMEKLGYGEYLTLFEN